jgi:hypothetical protein
MVAADLPARLESEGHPIESGDIFIPPRRWSII